MSVRPPLLSSNSLLIYCKPGKLFIPFLFLWFNSVYICGMNSELESILERILCLYRKFGIKSVTMDDAAGELGISKKTLYQYFADKDELVARVIEYEGTKRASAFDKICNQNMDAIAELLEVTRYLNVMMQDHSAVIDHDLKKYYPEHYARIQELRRDKMYESVLQNMRKGKKEGIFRNDLNEEIIAKLHVSRIMCMYDNPFYTISEMTSPKIFSEILVYHIRGISNDKGIKMLEEYLQNDLYKVQ